MFDGFVLDHVDVGEVTLRVRHGGDGPAVLLLHGHPRTSATWHRVAPLLVAAGFRVVCPDLRGYGRSSAPPTDRDHTPYSKRAMAADCAALMSRLGHEQFAAVGHDRGGYVAFRLAMDAPERVTRLVELDCVPIGEALLRCDARFAHDWFHWFFFGNPRARAHEVVSRDPQWWYRAEEQRAGMGEEAYAEFLAAISDPATVLAMCEDYRAGLGVDRRHDEEDRAAGRRVGCPTLVVWALRDDLEDLYGDVLAAWAPWASDVRGATLDCGHHMAEEAPEELARLVGAFARGS